MARAKAPRILRRIFRFFLFALILGVGSVIVWRFCSAGIPKKVKSILPNEVLTTAYETTGGKVTAFRQKQATITRGTKDAGYFSVVDCIFFPEAGQVQLVFRYNKSTLKHLAEDKGLDAVPEKSGTYFDVTLLRATDKTPDNKTDNTDPTAIATTRYAAEPDPVREETALYTYFRYTFNDIWIEDDTAAIFVDVYWLGDLDYSTDPYGTLRIWDWESENIPAKIPSNVWKKK